MRGDLRLVISCAYDVDGVDMGASIACSGACLTVVDKGRDADGQNWFAIDASAETISRTASGMWDAGRKLNLERALKLGEELGGHIVTGHVDGIAKVLSVTPEGESHIILFSVPAAIAPYIAAKGSVTLDGTSLTVNSVVDEGKDAHFTVNIIPHTWEMTTLCRLAPGDSVNVEIDVLARYLMRLKERSAFA